MQEQHSGDPGTWLGDRVIWIMGDQSYGRAPREIPKSHEMAKITWTSIAPKINPLKVRLAASYFDIPIKEHIWESGRIQQNPPKRITL